MSYKFLQKSAAQNNARVNSGGDIVRDNSPAAGESLHVSDRKGFPDIKNSEKDKTGANAQHIYRPRQHRYLKTDNRINDNALIVFSFIDFFRLIRDIKRKRQQCKHKQ